MINQLMRENLMKTLALLAGLVFIAIAIAGFAGLIPMAPMYAGVLAFSGALFAFYGMSRRRELVPTRGTANDLRDFV
jgi:tetrahydromethanopterin S-methyltransferase subunit C